jgi:hypothetical protein
VQDFILLLRVVLNLKAHELFASGNFHFIFGDQGPLWITGTVENETTDKRRLQVCRSLRPWEVGKWSWEGM